MVGCCLFICETNKKKTGSKPRWSADFSFTFPQVHPEGKYVVDIDKSIDITKITPSTRVALRNDSYVLHLILPSKVDPLVNLMKVEKVPDSTYDMIGGLDQQIKEIKEVHYSALFNIITV